MVTASCLSVESRQVRKISSDTLLSNDYFHRFQPDKNYQELLFRARYGLQSAELNDLQQQAFHQSKALGDTFYQNGHLIQGGVPVMQERQGHVQVSACQVYLEGAIRQLASAEIKLPERARRTFHIGIYVAYKVITEQEDGSLCDPAVSCSNADQPELQAAGNVCWGKDGALQVTFIRFI